MNTDVRDILELESQPKGDVLTAKEKKRPRRLIEPIKRPTGVSREVWSLIKKDDLDAPPLIPSTDTTITQIYKQPKARLRNCVRKWKWKEFLNSARTDNANFYHWRLATDETIDYPFAKFNKKIQLPVYNDQEYKENLEDDNWTKEETDYLMELCKTYDLRFYIIHDRWDESKGKARTIDEIKDRYYRINGLLEKLRHPDDNKEIFVFDLEHETKRREQLRKLFSRTKEQIDEEAYLIEELKKIEIRKRERERKSATVNSLLTAVDQPAQTSSNETIASTIPKQAVAMKRKHKLSSQQSTESTSPPSTNLSVSQNAQKAAAAAVISEKKSLIFKAVVESAGIKFPDSKTSGVSLRSYKMKLPPSVGLKKTKAIEQSLEKLQIEGRPMGTESVCEKFNELRSDIVLLYELKQALSNYEFELQTLQHRYEAIAPGKPLELIEMDSLNKSGDDSPKKISELFEISSTPTGSLVNNFFLSLFLSQTILFLIFNQISH